MKGNMNNFEEYPDLPIDLSTFISNRMILKDSMGNKDPNGFDPYLTMINKKKIENGEVNEFQTIKWPEKDLKELEEFCKKHGILGFNCGRMSPIAALSLLKNKMGIVDSTTEERIPYGYSKIGTTKSILHG